MEAAAAANGAAAARANGDPRLSRDEIRRMQARIPNHEPNDLETEPAPIWMLDCFGSLAAEHLRSLCIATISVPVAADIRHWQLMYVNRNPILNDGLCSHRHRSFMRGHIMAKTGC